MATEQLFGKGGLRAPHNHLDLLLSAEGSFQTRLSLNQRVVGSSPTRPHQLCHLPPHAVQWLFATLDRFPLPRDGPSRWLAGRRFANCDNVL